MPDLLRVELSLILEGVLETRDKSLEVVPIERDLQMRWENQALLRDLLNQIRLQTLQLEVLECENTDSLLLHALWIHQCGNLKVSHGLQVKVDVQLHRPMIRPIHFVEGVI